MFFTSNSIKVSHYTTFCQEKKVRFFSCDLTNKLLVAGYAIFIIWIINLLICTSRYNQRMYRDVSVNMNGLIEVWVIGIIPSIARRHCSINGFYQSCFISLKFRSHFLKSASLKVDIYCLSIRLLSFEILFLLKNYCWKIQIQCLPKLIIIARLAAKTFQI